MQTTASPGPPALIDPNDSELDLFKRCLAPLRAICKPPLDHEQVRGYFNALSNVPPEAVFVAASEIAASRQYPNWPMPGEIRAKAVMAMTPTLTAGEAWELARRALRRLRDERLDFVIQAGKRYGVAEWNERVFNSLPIAVAATLRICVGTMRDDTTSYAQFRDEYERQVTLLRRPLMLPAAARAVAGLLAKSDVAKQLEGRPCKSALKSMKTKPS